MRERERERERDRVRERERGVSMCAHVHTREFGDSSILQTTSCLTRYNKYIIHMSMHNTTHDPI